MTDIAVLVDQLSVADERIVRKMLEQMVDWRLGIADFMANLDSVAETRFGVNDYHNVYNFKGSQQLRTIAFEAALDEYIRLGKMS